MVESIPMTRYDEMNEEWAFIRTFMRGFFRSPAQGNRKSWFKVEDRRQLRRLWTVQTPMAII